MIKWSSWICQRYTEDKNQTSNSTGLVIGPFRADQLRFNQLCSFFQNISLHSDHTGNNSNLWKVELKCHWPWPIYDQHFKVKEVTICLPVHVHIFMHSEGDGDAFTFKIQVDKFCLPVHKNVRCWLKKRWSICLMLWKTFHEHCK